jgi:RNA polymerase-associated protein CTR9
MLSFTLPDQQDGEAYDIELSLGQDLDENLDGVFTLLETERMPRSYWMTVALAYAKHDKVEAAIDLLRRAKDVFGSGRAEDRLHVLNALCWLYLLKYRAAVRLKPGRRRLANTPYPQ